MKINGYPNIQEIMKTYASQKRKQTGTEGAVAGAGGEDTLELSAQARELSGFRAALRDVPEVRGEKVEQIKKEIAAGAYRADASKIADGIISERLLDKKV